MSIPRLRRRVIRCTQQSRGQFRKLNTDDMVASIFGRQESRLEMSSDGGTEKSLASSDSKGMHPGDLVWVKSAGKPHWPAQIVHPDEISTQRPVWVAHCTGVLVQFFATYECLYVEPANILPFQANLITFCAKCKARLFKIAVDEALAASRRASCPETSSTPPSCSERSQQQRLKRLANVHTDSSPDTHMKRPRLSGGRVMTPPSFIRRTNTAPSPAAKSLLPTCSPCLPSPPPARHTEPFGRLEELSRQAVLELQRMALEQRK
ncbi:hypothetical protein DFJ77DRAFT_462071 [Powellomyces hirtus]|nr:hypothetical protein DFJ77DRAFT_462071 [Powellomyces hirtus]